MSMGIKRGPSSVLAGARAGRLPTFFDFESRPLAPRAVSSPPRLVGTAARWHFHYVGKFLPHDKTRDLYSA